MTRTRREPRSTSTSSSRSATAPRPLPEAQATALIAAAGSGERLGVGGPKALVEAAGKPLLAWCLEAFAACDSVGRAVIAAPRGMERDAGALAPAGLEVDVVAGGAARSQSVLAALERADPGDGLVAIHDAARPLVTPGLIDACVRRLAGSPHATGVIAATAITDTVKRARRPRPAKGGFPGGGPAIAKTESREHLWAAQTPQVFRAAPLREALTGNPDRVAVATDDAMLIEKAGGTVLIEAAPASNLKVTTLDDLRIAVFLLGQSG